MNILSSFTHPQVVMIMFRLTAKFQKCWFNASCFTFSFMSEQMWLLKC